MPYTLKSGTTSLARKWWALAVAAGIVVLLCAVVALHKANTPSPHPTVRNSLALPDPQPASKALPEPQPASKTVGAPLTVQQMAEMCVDAELCSFCFNTTSINTLSFWVVPSVVTLDCPEATKWGLCYCDMYGSLLKSGDTRDFAQLPSKFMDSNLRTLGKMALDNPTQVVGAQRVLLKGASGGRSESDAWESQWLMSRSSEDDALVAKAAKRFAPIVADSKFREARAGLIRTNVERLNNDAKQQQELRDALNVSPELVKPRQELCERLAAASAKTQ